MRNVFEGYLYDLIVLIKEEALEAKKSKYKSSKADYDYNIGYLMGLHRVISMMKNQTIAFGIDEVEIGLADIDPERDLL